jgi:hypothetical protein
VDDRVDLRSKVRVVERVTNGHHEHALTAQAIGQMAEEECSDAGTGDVDPSGVTDLGRGDSDSTPGFGECASSSVAVAITPTPSLAFALLSIRLLTHPPCDGSVPDLPVERGGYVHRDGRHRPHMWARSRPGIQVDM